MKPSYYNTYIPLEGERYLLRNTLTGALLTVDADTKEAIECIGERKEEIPEALLSTLVQNGIIVPDDTDELLKFKYRYHQVCYNPQHLSFVLTPTARCNLSCCYCVQRVDESMFDKTTQTVTMSDATVECVLLFVKSMTESCRIKTLPLSFHGGEPLMAKEVILDILQDLTGWCEERSLHLLTNFVTNGTLLDQAFLDMLHDYTIGYVRTTFDGPEEIHNSFRHYRNGGGTYQDILATIGRLMDAHIRVRVQLNINKHYKRLPELFDDLKERGLSDILIEPLPVFDPLSTIPEIQKYYKVIDERFPILESQYSIPFKEMVEARAFVYRAAFERGFKLPASRLGTWTPCEGARAYTFVVGPSGEVYKCEGCILMKHLLIGHIGEKGHFERYPLFYEWMNNDPTTIEKCRECRLLPACGGGCIAARRLGNLPHFCEVRFAPEEEYIRLCLGQEYSI